MAKIKNIPQPGFAAPKTQPSKVQPATKLDTLVALLRRPEGANLAELTRATGWQAHSVRGALSGSLKKKHGLTIQSSKTEAGRTYKIPGAAR